MEKPQYPSEILPQQGWRQCICTQDLVERCPEAMLGRKLDGTKEQCINPEDGTIYLNVLPVGSIPNLSCSLLGTFFKVDHLHFLPDNEGKTPWREGTAVGEDMLVEENYNHCPAVTVVGWKVKEVAGKKLPYNRVFDKQKLYNEFKKASEGSAELRKVVVYLDAWEDLKANPANAKQRIAELVGEARVNHDPTMLNYWHFTIDIYPTESDPNPLKNASDGWRRNLAANLCDFLRRCYEIIADESQVAAVGDQTLWLKE